MLNYGNISSIAIMYRAETCLICVLASFHSICKAKIQANFYKFFKNFVSKNVSYSKIPGNTLKHK